MTEQQSKLIEFSIELSKKLNTESNRHTQNPIYLIQEDKKVYTNRYGDYDEVERLDSDCWEQDDLCVECNKKYENDEELPDRCDDCQDNCFRFYTWEEVLNTDTVFLTASECDEHIELNHYHYSKPRSYAISAWRSPELQELLKLISALTTKDGKSVNWYG